MIELKAYKGDVTIPVYGTIADAKVYLKREADKVIAHRKYKYCMAMADVYHLRMMLACGNPESILFRNACRRHRKYLELAYKIREKYGMDALHKK